VRGDPRFEKIVASLAPEEWGALAETKTDFADGFAAEKVTAVPRIQSQQHIRPRERAEKNGTIFVALKMGSGQQIGTCTSFFSGTSLCLLRRRKYFVGIFCAKNAIKPLQWPRPIC
jgi:hypothetical protein